jgi:hypothetical protein
MAAGATFTAMERLQRMTQNNGQPHLEPLADVGTATIAVGALLCGFLIGASGRLFVVSIIVALVAGPTSGGLVLLGAILAGAIATLVVIIGLATGHRPYLGVAVVAACAALIVGIFVGSSYGSPRGLGGWAVARVTPTPKIPMPSFPTYLEAHADVTVRLDAASGFTSNPTTGGPDGTFGHWCRSGPDSTLVSDVTAMDVARKGTSTIYARLQLTNPSLIDLGTMVSYPRVVLQLGGPSGMTAYLWSGPARVVAHHGMSGTVAFDALLADPAPSGLPRTLSGQLSWTCRAWSTP